MWLDMPEAGPSRPYKRTERARVAAWERQRKLEERVEKRGRWDKARRQAAEASMASASVSTVEGMRVAAITSSAAGSSRDSFIGSAMTAPTASSSTSPASGTALSEAFQPSSSTDAAVSSTSSSGFAQTTARNPDTPPPSRTFYTYSRTQPVATPTFVPGVTFDLKMAGELADEAVYAVEVDFGHGAGVTRRQIGKGSIGEVKRQGQGPAVVQKMMLQVDLGSSDMWVATTGCMSADCRAANLFDPRASIGSGVGTNLTYHSGSVSGEIMWEAVTLSTFSIAYQAFVAGASVVNQNLDGGEYSGILGLALPANSIILDEIPGTTSNDPDGAIFLDNLFGSGIYAPTQRIFSLALERREDVRTRSFLTLGSVDDKYCPSPCEPKYLPIIAQPSLGATGYLHWRISLQGIRATKWADQADGQGPDVQTIQLGPSIAVPSRSQPLAVLDSGGVAILVGNQAYADAIYAPWGITAGPDGLYRLPCKTQIALSFDFGGQWFDVHPLDLSWPDPTDPSQLTCIGAVQYTNQLGSRGDFVLGSAFLKNVYSIFSYPDPTARGTWQPAVGLYSLTNGSRASQDFYAVRYNRQSLSSVSANGPDMGGTSSTSPSAGSPGSEHGGSVMNTTAIVAGSVVGFFGIAAVLFCGWWFWLRHKYGDDGKVEYKEAPERKSVASTEDASSTRRRHRKHESAQRQRSMIDGYKDGFDDGASWTENGDSIRMAQLGEVPEEDEHTSQTQHTPRTETAAQLVDTSYAHSTPTMKLVDLVDPPVMTDGAIALPLTPVQLARQHSAVPSYISTFGDDLPATPGSTRPLLGQSPGLGTPEVVYNALTPPVAPVPPTRSNAARRTSTSPQRDFGFSLATAVPRSASMNMSGPFPSPLPVNSPGIARGAGGQAGSGRRPSANESTTSRPQRNSMRHPENSPMYDIQTGDYFDVKAAEPGWRRRGRSGDRGGEV